MSDLNLAREWPEEDRRELYASREELLLEARRCGFIILGNKLASNSSHLYAAVSLVQEGYAVLDEQRPGILGLSESGMKLAIGYTALKNG